MACFLSFIKEEENFYKNLLTKLDNSIIPKKTLENKFLHRVNFENDNANIGKNNENSIINLFWFKNNYLWCRYDSFIFIFFLN